MDKRAYLQFRKNLSLKNDPYLFLKHVLIDFTILVALSNWCYFFAGTFFISLASVGVSILMFRSFALMHEAVHGLITSSTSNDWIGTFYGGLAFLAFDPWKRSHLEHHYWSGNAEKDPVMALVVLYPKLPPWFQATLNFCWQAWIPVIAILQHLVFWVLSCKTLISATITGQLSLKMLLGVVWPPLFWTTTCYLLPTQVLSLVLLPGVFIYLMAVEIVNLPHHLKLLQQCGDSRLAIWEQYQSSRSCVYPQWIEKFITLNFNYHTEHHMFPDLSYRELSNIHQVLKNTLGSAMNCDEQFKWTMKYRSGDLGLIFKTEPPVSEAPATEYLAPTGTQAD